MQVQFRIPKAKVELLELFERLNSKERNQFIIKSLESGLAMIDINFINSHIGKCKVEIERFENILEWKKSYDKLKIEETVKIQQSEVLKEYFELYKSRESRGETIQDDYLTCVLPDIRTKLNYPLTLEQFKEYYKKNQEVKY